MHGAFVLNSCFNTKLLPYRYGIRYEGRNVVRHIRFFVTNGFVPSMLVFLAHVRASWVVMILSKIKGVNSTASPVNNREA